MCVQCHRSKGAMRNPSDCYCCDKGRPLRAKEMRNVFLTIDKTKIAKVMCIMIRKPVLRTVGYIKLSHTMYE